MTHNLHFFGVGESQLEQALHEMMLTSGNPTIAPYAKTGEVYLAITAHAPNRAEAERLITPVLIELCHRYPDEVYGIDCGSLEQALVQELIAQNKKIATAESCTGGLVSERITRVSGSSQVFDCGICSYANGIKSQLLGVSGQTLEQFGAVSEQTARAMANGVRTLAQADLGISVTGIAGPTGGTPDKPVGLVYVAVSQPEDGQVLELHLSRGYGDERSLIRHMAASYVLHLALKTIRPYFDCDAFLQHAQDHENS